MNLLYYHNNVLHFGLKNLPLTHWIKDYSSPIYLYDLDSIRLRAAQYSSAFKEKAQIHFAMKSNHNKAVLKALKSSSCHIDAVSMGELQWAHDAGFEYNEMIFSGVAKTKNEIEFAIQNQIKQINIESFNELLRIHDVAQKLGKKVKVAIRVNPDVDAKTHPHITTGLKENKFGLSPIEYAQVVDFLKFKNEFLIFQGISIHIGSQITSLEVLKEAILKAKKIFINLKSELTLNSLPTQKQNIKMNVFDIGGGVGIYYESYLLQNDMRSTSHLLEKEHELIKQYGEFVVEELEDLKCQIYCEPGRWLVAHSGVLITQIQYIKNTGHKKFAIVDTGMHHLMRPSLYQAYHEVLPLVLKFENEKIVKNAPLKLETYDIAGPICESTDVIAKNRKLSPIEQEDFLAISDVGAYGFVMANDYNLQPQATEICF